MACLGVLQASSAYRMAAGYGSTCLNCIVSSLPTPHFSLFACCCWLCVAAAVMVVVCVGL